MRNLPLLVAAVIASLLTASQSWVSQSWVSQSWAADDFNYTDMLARETPREVVRLVLTDVAKRGLVGQHHYKVTFETAAPGVQIAQTLRETFPQDMTIILQHRFENLVVNEQGFEVTVWFGGNPQRISVPFGAIKAFYDPSVEFSLPLKP